MSGSASKDFEGGKTPKSNLRQERISHTRPGLVADVAIDLTIIKEVTESVVSDYFKQSSLSSNPNQNSESVPNGSRSSDHKSLSSKNLEEVDVDDKAKSGRNEPSLNNFEFDFDFDSPGPIRLDSDNNSQPNDIFDLVDKAIEPKISILPPLPQSMMKKTSLIKAGDKKNKSLLKVGF
jgi:hypothetical protein